MIFLAVINTSAVVIAGGDVVLRPGPKCLDTTIDLAPVGVYSPFSGSIYGNIYTMAPKTLDPVKRDPTTMKAKAFVEEIRPNVLTSCDNDQGSKNMHLIAPLFRPRQEVTGLESSLSREKQEEKHRGSNC